jgi:hypothetical protein
MDVRRDELEAELTHAGEARRDPAEVFGHPGRAGHASAVLAKPADRLGSRPQRDPRPGVAAAEGQFRRVVLGQHLGEELISLGSHHRSSIQLDCFQYR